MKFLLFFISIISIAAFGSCTSGKSESTETGETAEKREYIRQENLVDTITLKKVPFRKELISNGKLNAVRKSDLQFSIGGQLKTLPVRNGQQINASETIAFLDKFEHVQKVEHARASLHSAILELEDILLGRGYKLADTSKIDKALYQMANLRSGYSNALRDLKTAEHNLQGTILKAPFSGKIANLKYRQHEQVSPGEKFCTLIDDSEFEVEFHLVESEIKEVGVGDKVKIVPFSFEEVFEGAVTEINPLVDENGLVQVKAKVKNRQGKLLEGMNVKVSVAKTLAGQLVVPKTAVVLRQNQEVLFKVVNGKAYWTYIKIDQENSDSYIVRAHPEKGATLEPGDIIITSGNLNLAHESEVKVK